MHLKTHGIVLGQTPFGSQDKMLTLLTSDQGMITAIAKTPGRKKSRLSAASEVLAYSELTLFEGRTHYILDSADLENNFFKLREDLGKLSLAGYLCELTRFVIPQKETAAETLRLLLNTLYLLEKGARPNNFLKAVYELRLMCLSGFQPDVEGCAGCGETEGDFWLLPGEGVLACKDCLPDFLSSAEREPYRVPFPQAVRRAFFHVIQSEPGKIFSFKLSSDAEKLFADAAEAFTIFQTGGKFSSLDFYHSVMG